MRSVALAAALAALSGAAWADTPYSGQPAQTGSMYNGANVSHFRPAGDVTRLGQATGGGSTGEPAASAANSGTTVGSGAGGSSGGGEQLGGEH